MLAMSALMPLQFTTLLLFLQDTAPENVRLLLAGVLGAMRGGVMLLAGIPGGALADRMSRRRLLLITQSVAIAANAGIAALMLAGVGGTTGAILLTFVAGGAMTVITCPPGSCRWPREHPATRSPGLWRCTRLPARCR
jgi:nitrate/nitrite transporter NarK